VMKGKGHQMWDGKTEGSEIMLPLRTVDVVAYARVRERADMRAFEKEELAANWEEVRIHSTNSSCGVLEDC